jgi:hypothetical protein
MTARRCETTMSCLTTFPDGVVAVHDKLTGLAMTPAAS